MERGEQPGQVPQAGLDGLPGQHQRAQGPVLGHPSHHEQVLARGTGPVVDVVDAEVHVRGQAPVELELPVADRLARLPGGEVQ